MDKRNIFFVGAGGIGMAALERYFLAKGFKVGGYDLTPSKLTHALENEGVAINYEGSLESVPSDFRDPSDTLVVYTPAVPFSLECLEWFGNNGFEILKRSEVLGMITRSTKGICFAGTHGKTTSSSIAAHILNLTPGVGCNAFLGGVLRNYGSNLILSETSPFSVIEADEFDRSFHRLAPYIAVVSSADPDHLDIYGDEKEYLASFSYFTSLIKDNGFLLIHTGLKVEPKIKPTVKSYTYSSDGTKADFMAGNIRREGNRLVFDMKFPDGSEIKDFRLGVPVYINIDNSVAAMGSVWLAGVFNENAAKEALLTYKGAERRFEIRWEEDKTDGRIIIDDYAHHPKEIEASLKSVRSMFPGRKITVVFQPHLYTRTRDFADEFASALSLADEAVLVDLYPARELPIPGISSFTILDKINLQKKSFTNKENFPKYIKNSNFDVLLTLGAGDLPNYIPDLIESLEGK